MNKKDAELNYASFYSEHFVDVIRRFRDIKLFWKIFSKKRPISKTANQFKKRFFDPIRRFRDIKLFLENIFQKTLYLKNGETDQKKVVNKKDAKLHSAIF